MSDSIDELKTIYDDTPIPENLDSIVKKAIKRGRITMKNKNRNTGYLKAISSVAAALLMFTIALNASPAFATSVKQLPGGDTIVRLLNFVGGSVTGGDITDGQDIKEIQVERPVKKHEVKPVDKPVVKRVDKPVIKSEDKTDKQTDNIADKKEYYETLTVDLYQGADAAAIAGHFTITQKTHPYSIEVNLSGVRAFSAADAFPDLSGMKVFDSIYRLITLDDSAHRFVVTFKQPVSIEVSEQQYPARLIIKVIKDKEAEEAAPYMYSLRTLSLPFGEVVGIAENILRYELGSENARLLMDAGGLYLAEEGLYATEVEAEARLAELKQYKNFMYEMHIEKRKSEAIPGTIGE